MTKDEALSAKHEGATTVALKMALEALGHFEKAGLATLKTIDAITAIREALALSESSTKCEETSHAQPEPVIDKSAAVRIATSLGWKPKRKPLTDEEIDKLPWEPHEGNPMTFAEGLRYFARAIEAAHGIKE